MILDSIYNGTFRPGEIGAMDHEEYRQAMREVGLFQSQLKESIDKEDCLLLEELIKNMQYAQDAACASSFQYGFSAGILLTQEAQTLVRSKDVPEDS